MQRDSDYKPSANNLFKINQALKIVESVGKFTKQPALETIIFEQDGRNLVLLINPFLNDFIEVAIVNESFESCEDRNEAQVLGILSGANEYGSATFYLDPSEHVTGKIRSLLSPEQDYTTELHNTMLAKLLDECSQVVKSLNRKR